MDYYRYLDRILFPFRWIYSNIRRCMCWCWNYLVKERRKTEVQILIRDPTKLTRTFKRALKQKFKWTVVDKRNVDPNMPLIALCQVASRLRVDVESVMKGIPKTRTSEYVIIAIHACFEEDLPSISSADTLNVDANKIRLIDMGIDDNGRIYECEVNTNATMQLQKYVQSIMDWH